MSSLLDLLGQYPDRAFAIALSMTAAMLLFAAWDRTPRP